MSVFKLDCISVLKLDRGSDYYQIGMLFSILSRAALL